MVSWQRLHTSRLSAVQVFFQLRQLWSVRRSLTTEATCALVQAFIICRLVLLQLCSGRGRWCLSSATPVCAERGSPLGLRGSSPRPHHAGSCQPTLASSTPVNYLQDGGACVEVPTWCSPRYLADLCVPDHSVHGCQQLRSTASGTVWYGILEFNVTLNTV